MRKRLLDSLCEPMMPGWYLALAAGAIYVALFFGGSALLPETIFRDSAKIQDLLDSGLLTDSRSFGATAWLYAALPESVRSLFVFFTGIGVIYAGLRRTSVGTSVIAIILFAPAVVLALFTLTKEVFIFWLTAASLILLSRLPSRLASVAAIFFLYLAYAFFVRSYYGLIACAFVALVALSNLPWYMRLYALPTMLLAALLLPNEIYVALQGPRDAIASYVVYSSPNVVRTIFFNILPPDGPISFSINYLYACSRLVFPVIYDNSFKGIFLQIFNIILVIIITYGVLSSRYIVSYASLLLLSHLLVLLLFESDLGTYLRHVSSALLYVTPCLALLEGRLGRYGAMPLGTASWIATAPPAAVSGAQI